MYVVSTHKNRIPMSSKMLMSCNLLDIVTGSLKDSSIDWRKLIRVLSLYIYKIL
jgi:hypothetical protein